MLSKYFHSLPSKVYSFFTRIFSFLSLLTSGSVEKLEDEEERGIPLWAEEDAKPVKDFERFVAESKCCSCGLF